MQLHQSWAQANNVNLLVAGTNDPLNGRTGTGIYAGQYGALIASMTTDDSKKKLYLSVLPKKGYEINTNNNNNKKRTSLASIENQQVNVDANAEQFTNRITGIKLGRDNDIDLYTTLPLNDYDGNEIQRQICHNDLCCNFHIKRTSISPQSPVEEGIAYEHYYYRLAAFKGMGTFLNTELDDVAVCALFACTGDHLYMCARIFPETTMVENRFTFDFIQISGNFSQRSKNVILPTSVDSMLMPLPINAFELKLKQQLSNVSLVTYTLLQPQADLLTFGIYVNYFLDDTKYDHHQKGAANSISIHKMLWILMFTMLSGIYTRKLSFN